jgi:hypothetical protein
MRRINGIELWMAAAIIVGGVIVWIAKMFAALASAR